MDDRTPFEKAINLEGVDLSEYRLAKTSQRVSDPPFYFCPRCRQCMIGTQKTPDEICPECRKCDRDAEIKKWKDAEFARNQAKISAGSLADKVKRANEKKQIRVGAECGYPDD